MQFFSSEPEAPEQRDPRDEFWFNGVRGSSEIGVEVTIKRARQVPVVNDCISTLAESVSSLQLGVFERVSASKVRRADNHPVVKLLRNPNKRQTTVEFVYMIVSDLSSAGDFYAKKIWNEKFELVGLKRIDPETVEVDETQDETKRFRFTDKFGVQHILLEDEVWHIPRPPVEDGIKGTSPILDDGREAIAVAIALQRYANSLFTNDATPSYVWAMPAGQSFSDKGDKARWLKAMARWLGGKNRWRPAVVEFGIEPKRLGLTSEEAQFLDTRKELWLDLTRLWRMQPHKVGILDRATFSNIEEQSLDYVTGTLRPLLELIEASVNKFLIEDEEFYFEFNVSSLLRGDIKARYEAYALGRQWGWLSVNDVLRLENQNGIGAAGDRYIEPLNMVPVGSGSDRRDNQGSVEKSIAFLRESTATNGGRSGLEMIRDAA
ncbi:portal protein, HK97 family, putative [Roseobacter sp. SK209-2-6]|uniref:phage portal protein n=1 Tax=Roseobacter sp. SK209-2-6 TaxID=388739 RepID=UPI0000F3C7A5|nr:phage portal protein [Roseobacter sp. SK209-2-6]EBA18391.1 portal protein, HK97 family, putative [Roseobacter sp. SK209-2-6]